MIDSYHYDVYDEYDDFGLDAWGKGGGGGTSCGSKRIQKRADKRGGSQGSGSVYSAKHVRLMETKRDGWNKSGSKQSQNLNKYELAKSWNKAKKCKQTCPSVGKSIG